MILIDGYSTTIGFALGGITVRVMRVKPPGLDGGGGIDFTSMDSVTYRQMVPKALVTLTNCTVVVQYDPVIYTELLAMLNIIQNVTISFPDGSLYIFAGFVSSFEPGENQEGELPTGSIVIIPSNVDGDLVNDPPLYVAGA